MIGPWISGHAPDRVFVAGPGGTITYGEVAAAAAVSPSARAPGRLVVEPDGSREVLLQLLAAPAAGRQMVVVAPGLSATERDRRLLVASAAAEREAATVMFTSGSGGPAKAVRLTSANWEAAVSASATHLGHHAGDVWLAPLPLHHVGGLSVLYRSAYVGGRVKIVPRFEVAAVVEHMRREVTLVSLVPTMLRRILDHDRGSFSNLRAVLVGGGPIPPGLMEEAWDRGIRALPTYGMTETCGQVATLAPGSPPRYAAHPLPGIELRIGDAGRIELRGPQISPGYADEDDRPPDDWFVTPDLGELDSDGAVRVLGRADDMILSGGENVSPAAVEAVLSTHPGVEGVVVTGMVDREWGQRVVAAYEGSVEAGDLEKWAKARLTAAEVPKTWRRLRSLPSTGLGKPDRGLVREMFE